VKANARWEAKPSRSKRLNGLIIKWCVAPVRWGGEQKVYRVGAARVRTGVYWSKAQSILLCFARAGSTKVIFFFIINRV
jgi:hypothetical protein